MGCVGVWAALTLLEDIVLEIYAGSLVIGLVIGLAFGFFIGMSLGQKNERERTEAQLGSVKSQADGLREEARREADQLLDKARSESERVLNEARSTATQLQRDAEIEAERKLIEQQRKVEEEAREQRADIAESQRSVRKKEESLDKREELLEKRTSHLDERDQELKQTERSLNKRTDKLKRKEGKIDEVLGEAEETLHKLAGMSASEARDQLIDQMVGEAKVEAGKRIKQLEEEAQNEAEKRAKRIVGIAIQRYAGEYVTERTVSTVNLPSEDMKGRIIGREGRNIRAIEAATGVDLIIDDTPEAVVVSAFDPVRREIARLSLERLIADGRIHPTRIEDVVNKVKREVDALIKEAGEQAAFELGLHGLHPEVLRLMGRLRYRTSYGQNIWSHSIEVGWLCGMMAAELGLNVKAARRAGLLHDIGKAIDHEMEGSHALIGAEFCKKYGEKPLIVNAIASHHNEVPPESVIAHLVAAADALSGARPGARREILETYIRRLEELERISLSFEGVERCYAIQAGREIRVMVNHERIDDGLAHVLSRDIARKIEQELTYPGQIKVTVIRETRATEFAR